MAETTAATSAGTTTNAASYASGAFTPAADDLLVVLVGNSDTATSPPTLTSPVSEKTFTHVGGGQGGGRGDHLLHCFVADQLASNESQTVTVDYGGDRGA